MLEALDEHDASAETTPPYAPLPRRRRHRMRHYSERAYEPDEFTAWRPRVPLEEFYAARKRARLARDRRRQREANEAFQDDYELGDASHILPLPLERAEAAENDPADEAEVEEAMDPLADASSEEDMYASDEAPRYRLRFDRDQRLVRYLDRPLAHPMI